ncbi:uncharacterized protein BKA78DRAFT_313407 [Phyllosticta capitalensis]|uniref:uncharacterized protein n=1 Tax=Phyllosticta capitalensis TaxID=121624 RepID=UPI003131DA32
MRGGEASADGRLGLQRLLPIRRSKQAARTGVVAQGVRLEMRYIPHLVPIWHSMRLPVPSARASPVSSARGCYQTPEAGEIQADRGPDSKGGHARASCAFGQARATVGALRRAHQADGPAIRDAVSCGPQRADASNQEAPVAAPMASVHPAVQQRHEDDGRRRVVGHWLVGGHQRRCYLRERRQQRLLHPSLLADLERRGCYTQAFLICCLPVAYEVLATLLSSSRFGLLCSPGSGDDLLIWAFERRSARKTKTKKKQKKKPLAAVSIVPWCAFHPPHHSRLP